jgi:hypothetical protein
MKIDVDARRSGWTATGRSVPIFATLSANSGQAELVDDQALVRLSTTRTATVLNIARTRALEPAIGRVLRMALSFGAKAGMQKPVAAGELVTKIRKLLLS